MKTIKTSTIGNGGEVLYYHYHLIGVGIITNFIVKSQQLISTCEHTGVIIECHEFKDKGGLTKEEFYEICDYAYLEAADTGGTLNLDYMDDPTIVGCIGVDFNLIKN
jgi:hypothetical protein